MNNHQKTLFLLLVYIINTNKTDERKQRKDERGFGWLPSSFVYFYFAFSKFGRDLNQLVLRFLGKFIEFL